MPPASQTVQDNGRGPDRRPLEATGPGASASRYRHALALVVYAVLTVGLTWPLAWHVSSKVVLHPGLSLLVPYHHLYLFARYHHAFDEGLKDYWDANIFYPHLRVLTYSENVSAPSAMTWPVHLLSHNATLCYNLVVLSAMFLNALAMYVLALAFRVSWRLALVAGGAMAFCPYLFEELYCPAMLLVYPAPLLLAALHRLLRRPTWTGVILVGVCGLWLLTTCYQYAFFCALFGAGWMVWFIRQVPWRRLWYKLLVVGALSAVPAWGLLSTVSRTHRDMGFTRSYQWAMTWQELLTPASGQRLYHDLLGLRMRETVEKRRPAVCFPGVTFSLLAAVGALAALFGRADDDETRRRRQAYRFCLASSLAAVTVALGPQIDIGPIRMVGPYALLAFVLPPFDWIRSLYRLFIFAQLFAAILAGVGLGRCLQAVSTSRRRIVIGLVAVSCLLAESVWVPLNLVAVRGRPGDVHPLYRRLAELDLNAPLMELPVPKTAEQSTLDALYTFSSIHTWQPLVNGYASYIPGLYRELCEVMAEFPSSRAIRHLQALGVRYVLLRGAHMSEEALKAVKRFPSLRQVERCEPDVLYELSDSNRRSLDEWMGETRFRIERGFGVRGQARARLEFKLAASEVIPVLPGDRSTRWRLNWRDASNRVIQTQALTVRNSHWLTAESNTLGEPIDLPTEPGTYTVELVDPSDGRELGSCTFRVR